MKPHTRKALFFAAKMMTVTFFAYSAALVVVSNYAREQQDSPLYVYYICATGANPPGLALYMHDNGTHTIDMYSCKWIKNADPELRDAEHAEITAMYCSEMLERHGSGEPYLSSGNERLAESKAAGCAAIRPQYGDLAELFAPRP